MPKVKIFVHRTRRGKRYYTVQILDLVPGSNYKRFAGRFTRRRDALKRKRIVERKLRIK